MKRLRVYLPALSIFCLALLVRIIYNSTVARGYIPRYDAGYYNGLGQHLIDEHCFCVEAYKPTTGRAPFWPFIIAAIYTITGPKNFYARLFLCFLGAGTCVLTYLYAKDMFNRWIGWIASVIAACYPGLYIYDGWLYSESVYTFLLLAFAYSLFLLQSTAQVRWMIASGFALALAALTRPNGLILLAMLLVWAGIMLKTSILSWRVLLRSILSIVLITLCLIIPWTLRNYKEAHTFIPVATGSGLVLAGVYNDTALTDTTSPGMWVPPDFIRPPVDYHGHNCCDYTGEADSIAYARHWIQTHLSSMPYMLGLHFTNMWRPYTSEDGLPVREFPQRTASKIVWAMMIITPLPIFLLAALGLLATWRRWRELCIIYLMLLFTIIQNTAFYGSSRFRAPIEPLLVILLGGALWWLTQDAPGTLRAWLSKRRAAQAPAAETIAQTI